MAEEARLVTELNKGWVYTTNPTDFFRGYDTFSEMLRASPDVDPKRLLDHYVNSVVHKTDPNDQVIRFQLLRRARFRGNKEETEQFYRLADDLVTDRCLTNQDERSVTFLAYQGVVSRKDDAYAALRKEVGYKDQENRIRRKLLRVFKLINSKNRATFFNSLLGEDETGTDLFDAICSVHHQVIDNIDHWMDYHENPNWSQEKSHLFGDTLVFRVSRLTYADHGPTSHRKLDETFLEYLRSNAAAKNKTELKYWILDYYDNGRGLIENLRQFGRFDEDNFNLSSAIRNKMSIRGDIGSDRRNGEGYSTIIEEAAHQGGYFALTSGGQQLTYSPLLGSDLRHQSVREFQFGTHLNIAFPG